MKTYVITVSEFFPKTHPKAGVKTNFPLAIKHYDKIHTIRANYELWKKRFEKIDKGEACLSIRVWEGKPYTSKQQEIFRYDKTHKIGLERLTFKEMIMTPFECIRKNDGRIYTPNISKLNELAKNDCLELNDFKSWFKEYDLSKEMAIIHFTDFRYCH